VWNDLDSAEAIDRLLVGFGGFHDACLREISVATETYVGEGMAMSCPSNLDTSVRLFFQRGGATIPALEIDCREVTSLHLEPSAEGCDSIIAGGAIGLREGQVRLAVNFIGGPLKAAPDSRVFIPARPLERPDLEVTARSMSWRPLENSLGRARRYRPQEGG
jgi:hypothetical protein